MVRTPSLVINKEIVLNGRFLPKSQLKKLIEEKRKSIERDPSEGFEPLKAYFPSKD